MTDTNKTEITIPEEAQLHAALLSTLGGIAGTHETTLAMYRRAVGLNPCDATHLINLAGSLINSGEDEEAKQILDRCIAAHERILPAWQMLGVLATHRGELDEAIRCFGKAYEINPEHGQAAFDLASGYFRAGRWAEAWPLYARRHEILPATGPMPDCPRWQGEKVAHLCVWGDQGHGDRFQFSRFLPWARERAGKITFLTNPETIPLLYGYKALLGGEIAPFYDPAKTKFDAHVCIADLPRLYGCTPDNIPPDPGLLSPAATTDRLGTPGLKIGIAWAGNRDHPNDRIRSMKFTDLLPLTWDPRNSVFSLQCGPPAADVQRARAQRIVTDMSGMIDGEWAHCAALMQNLDLIVTVDTAIAHVAGCLKVPTFLLLARFSDWRWLWDRHDTPWYPSVRIFRQEKPGDWKAVVRQVGVAIAELHNQRAMLRLATERLRLVDPHAPGTADEKEPDVAHVLRKVLRPGDCFVDVGANVGMHTTLAAELVGSEGKVFAFEPGQARLELLKATEALPQVEVIVSPLWHSAENVTLHHCREGSGGDCLWDTGKFPTNTLSREGHETVTLLATTIDERLAGVKPRLIKIDTEGAELHVLRGAVELLLSEHRPPFIVTELHEFGLRELGGSQMALRDYMREAGYETFVLFPDGAKPQHVLPGHAIETRMIVNLLFARQSDVDSAWAGVREGDVRVQGIRGYVPVEAQASAA